MFKYKFTKVKVKIRFVSGFEPLLLQLRYIIAEKTDLVLTITSCSTFSASTHRFMEGIYCHASIDDFTRAASAASKSFLPDGATFTGNYDQFLYLKMLVQNYFQQFGMEHYYLQCSEHHSWPANLAADMLLEGEALTPEKKAGMQAARIFSAQFFNRLLATVDPHLALEIGSLEHKTGFAAWDFLNRVMVQNNSGFFSQIAKRLDARTLDMHGGNMRQMITQFNSDFKTLEDAGKSSYSMEDKLEKIDVAQKKCGNKYKDQFSLIDSLKALDHAFTYDKATELLVAFWNKNYDTTNHGITLGATNATASSQ